jgi:hypothetical protein
MGEDKRCIKASQKHVGVSTRKGKNPVFASTKRSVVKNYLMMLCGDFLFIC